MADDGAELVAALVQRQRTHPPLEGLPPAALIEGVPLFVGEARAAQDAAFLARHGISAVVSLGTGRLAPEACATLDVDVLDVEDELLIRHLAACIAFLEEHTRARGARALVHCVYGQSRSAAVCVAFLMAARRLPLRAAYDAVQRARPCICINAGFLRQLELFQRMDADPSALGASRAHAEFRAMVAAKDWAAAGAPAVVGQPLLAPPGQILRCRKCRAALASPNNQLPHDRPASRTPCATGLFIEPMQWMTRDAAFPRAAAGKLQCPACRAKLGAWDWRGTKYVRRWHCPCAGDALRSLTPSRPPAALHAGASAAASASRRSSSWPAASSTGRCNGSSRSPPAAAPSSASTIGAPMGSLASSEQHAALCSSPGLRAATALSATIPEQAVPRLVRKTRDCFALTLADAAALVPDAGAEDVALVFRLLDNPETGLVCACELASVLLLLAPQLPAEAKLRGASTPHCGGIFETFNVSTLRQGELVADEATLLFRSVAAALLKVAGTGGDALAPTRAFEDLTKAAFADRETLTVGEFARVCHATEQVASTAGRWLWPAEPLAKVGEGLE